MIFIKITFLINKYVDFKNAFDHDNNELMISCFQSLRKLAFGFIDNRITKDVYKEKEVMIKSIIQKLGHFLTESFSHVYFL